MGPPDFVASTLNDPTALAELTAAFYEYEAALVTNDVPTLTRLFLDAPQTVRFGPTETLYGSQEIERFRRSRSPVGLGRRLGRVTITSVGHDFGTTTAEFTRTGSGVRGRQTQTWVRSRAGWRVLLAHVSTVPQARAG